MIPYSTASDAVMKRSRSRSRSTCSTGRPLWNAMICAIRLVVESTSRSWISMSLGAPCVPAEPWWIMIFELGRARRLPGAPAHRIIAAADIPIPTQIVETGGRTCCITS